MTKPTVSVVTAVYNRASTIGQALDSVHGQSWPHVEHILIDGGSTDGTLPILQARQAKLSVLVSERDTGIYDALNKGFALATGDIVGLMHSDDFYADDEVLRDVVNLFSDPAVDAVYGDLDYVAKDDTSRVIRHWRSGPYDVRRLGWGWMPPHPTLFLRRSVVERFGTFDTRFRIAADYDAILRYFYAGGIRPAYLARVLIKMRVGGESNRSIARVWRKSLEDYEALRSNGVGGVGALAWKNLSKLRQFL